MFACILVVTFVLCGVVAAVAIGGLKWYVALGIVVFALFANSFVAEMEDRHQWRKEDRDRRKESDQQAPNDE